VTETKIETAEKLKICFRNGLKDLLIPVLGICIGIKIYKISPDLSTLLISGCIVYAFLSIEAMLQIRNAYKDLGELGESTKNCLRNFEKTIKGRTISYKSFFKIFGSCRSALNILNEAQTEIFKAKASNR
jgi:hypothetical protein